MIAQETRQKSAIGHVTARNAGSCPSKSLTGHDCSGPGFYSVRLSRLVWKGVMYRADSSGGVEMASENMCVIAGIRADSGHPDGNLADTGAGRSVAISEAVSDTTASKSIRMWMPSALMAWFRVWGFGFLVAGSAFGVWGFGFRVSDFGFRVSGFEFLVSSSGCGGWLSTRQQAINASASRLHRWPVGVFTTPLQ